MTILETLKAVKGTLNEVTVNGEENLDRVLACIRVLKECIKSIESLPGKEAKADADPDPE